MKTQNIFPIFLLVSLFFLCNCCRHESNSPNVYGGVQITFNKDSVVFDTRKNKATFKAINQEGMEIPGVYTFIEYDTIFIWNEKIPHIGPFNQQFYYYRDTVYGEWYTIVCKGNKIHVRVDENATAKQRKISVVVESGDDYGNVYVIQKAAKDK